MTPVREGSLLHPLATLPPLPPSSNNNNTTTTSSWYVLHPYLLHSCLLHPCLLHPCLPRPRSFLSPCITQSGQPIGHFEAIYTHLALLTRPKHPTPLSYTRAGSLSLHRFIAALHPCLLTRSRAEVIVGPPKAELSPPPPLPRPHALHAQNTRFSAGFGPFGADLVLIWPRSSLFAPPALPHLYGRLRC